MELEKIVNYAKQYGFIFQGSEIYGGLANTWDYGPLGIELKENVRKAWWQKFVQENQYNVGIQSSILMNPKVWEVSGHVNQATDPLMDCRECKERFRADKIISDFDSNVNYEILYSAEVCNPREGQLIEAVVDTVDETNTVCYYMNEDISPIEIYLFKQHYLENQEYAVLKSGDRIIVKILETQIEFGSKKILAIAEFVKKV